MQDRKEKARSEENTGKTIPKFDILLKYLLSNYQKVFTIVQSLFLGPKSYFYRVMVHIDRLQLFALTKSAHILNSCAPFN